MKEIREQIKCIKAASEVLPDRGFIDMAKLKVQLATVSAWATKTQLLIARIEAGRENEKRCASLI